jgi:UPF0755 protein
MIRNLLLIAAVLLLFGAGLVAWFFWGPATSFSEKKKALYIPSSGANRASITDSLVRNGIVKNEKAFAFLADRMNYWKSIKPGKYEIEQGTSLFTLLRRLRNGQQTPVNLVINKLRTPQDLAKLVSRRLETDSAEMMAYMQSDSFKTKRSITEHEALAYVLPDTYTYFWNSDPDKIFQKLADASSQFWNQDRKAKAARLSLTPLQVAIIASIVDEESNALDEKDTIASVYLNRLRIGMPLQADPTVRFALQDFTIKRVYEKHLQVASPYNTYRNPGLPPGPICTPQKKTIDAVLDAPQTGYVYFVASPEFDGTHDFSITYEEHQKKARVYQAALTAWMQKQKEKQQQANAQ